MAHCSSNRAQSRLSGRLGSLVALVWVCIVVATGCAAPTPVRPIHAISYPPRATTADTAILLFPGRRSRAEDFEHEGFIAAVRSRRLNVEVVAVDAHLGYYLEERYRELPTIIHEDVVRPLLQRARKKLWLVGTSLGALGAVAYAKKQPDAVVGLFLMGAYIGEDPILDAIERAGGLARWNPVASVGYDYEQRTWQWLKGYFSHEERPQLFLGWGDADRFARASQLIAPGIPAQHVFLSAGGHDFETWRKLWGRFLDTVSMSGAMALSDSD